MADRMGTYGRQDGNLWPTKWELMADKMGTFIQGCDKMGTFIQGYDKMGTFVLTSFFILC
ncbi:hypothetical protein [Parabacteroides sp. PF5-9]|uniref:hypothetical protein n=1 Tax=Parabacteroides sp. PF5-9 TaxID=1742404 RepID=UPI002475278A|nr:hypothetical protein [Parabacteroides sp. PF5-9]MDH6358938.1 hypothetical protein [Parabacteroides sp. PF5-9]